MTKTFTYQQQQANLMDDVEKQLAEILKRPKYSVADCCPKLESGRPAHIVTEEDYTRAASNRVNDREHPTVSEEGLVLWLLAPGENDRRKKYIKGVIQQRAPELLKHLRFVTLGTPKNKITQARTKTTIEPSPDAETIFRQQLGPWLPRARMIVVNHFDILVNLLAGSTGHGNKKTLAAYRGSVYINEFFGGIPALVIEDAFKCYMPNFQRITGKDEANKAQSVQYFDYDIDKLKRLHANPNLATSTFDERFEVVSSGNLGFQFNQDTPDQNEWRKQGWVADPNSVETNTSWFNLHRFEAWLSQQTLLALDKETSMGHITCLSVTGISNNDVSTMKTWVIPHIAPTAEGNEYMSFTTFYGLLKSVLQHPAPKIWQNGNYDAHYAMFYNLPPTGLNYDTQYMWHSYRAQMPQSLASISSIFCNDYYYWKDEIKGGSGEKTTQVKYSVPVTPNGLMTYWRYAGLDTHMCMTAFLELLKLFDKTPWMQYNYAKEYALLRGPLFHASFCGVNMDKPELKRLINNHRQNEMKALHDLRAASNGIVQTDTDAEAVTWLYKTLGATPPPAKAGRKTNFSVEQKQLILVSEQHPIFEKAVNYLRAHREPKKQIEMYQNLKDRKGRLMYGYSLAPYTGRLASRGSSFWVGTNVQNINAKMRSFITADPGKVLIDIDYSQADLYHFAVACGDKNMMKNVFDDRDTHTVHVETILQLPYEEGMRLRKSEDPVEDAYMNHSITGFRQIIKKLTHGGNYGMTPQSVYVNAGKEALIAAAIKLGHDPSQWTREDFYRFCDQIMIPYFEEYSQQKPWRREILRECIENNGMATCFGGLSVYFDDYRRTADHASLTRALLAFYGQGGTSGMINESMLRMYYGNDDRLGQSHVAVPDDNSTFMREHNIDLLLQTHDSLTYQVPIEVLKERKLLDYILTMMELTCNFNGVSYKVPCEVNVGHSWSKGMPEIKPSHDDRDLVVSLLENYHSEGLLV